MAGAGPVHDYAYGGVAKNSEMCFLILVTYRVNTLR
jgi:hypothetical protein